MVENGSTSSLVGVVAAITGDRFDDHCFCGSASSFCGTTEQRMNCELKRR